MDSNRTTESRAIYLPIRIQCPGEDHLPVRIAECCRGPLGMQGVVDVHLPAGM